MEGPRGDEVSVGTATEVADLRARSTTVEDVSFGAALERWGAPGLVWTAPDGTELLGLGAVDRFTAENERPLEAVRRAAVTRFDRISFDGPTVARPRAIGGAAFDPVADTTWPGFPSASFVVPEVQVVRTERTTHLTVIGDGFLGESLEECRDRLERLPPLRPTGRAGGVIDRRHRPDREGYVRAVRRALGRIRDGPLEKVVLATSLEARTETPVDVPATLERLRRHYPECYRFIVDPGKGPVFFGAPPERLVASRGERLHTEALAGSVPSGESPEGSASEARRLRDQEKFQHEHRLVLEDIESSLAPLASEIDVAPQRVRTLRNIQHLETPIEARIDASDHVLDVVAALHPTPAVGGMPTEEALAVIRELEPFDRGWYAAPVGWFDGRGDGEFAVGIRSGLVDGRDLRLFAGNGIVADSDPAAEWAEALLKLDSVASAMELPDRDEP